MSLLNVSGISFRYSTTELFREATFAVNEGDRLAIVGANGAGKSTLLRILAGELEPCSGSVARRRGLTVASAGQPWDAPAASLFELVNSARDDFAAEAGTRRILSGLGFSPAEWELPPGSLS